MDKSVRFSNAWDYVATLELDATGYLPKGHYYAIVTNIVVTDEFITYLFYL